MKVALPRLTFRLHDNILLDGTDALFIIIQQERLPTNDYNKFLVNMSWGYQQYSLLLQTIMGHRDDLKKYNIPVYLLYVSKSELGTVYKHLNKYFDEAVTDYITDPVYTDMNELMSQHLQLKTISTFTLLDWREKEHSNQLKKYYTKAKPFSKLKPLKDYILSQSISVSVSDLVKHTTAFSLPSELNKYNIDITKELTRIHNEMDSMNMKIHNFGRSNHIEYDKQLLDYSINSISMIDGDEWYKPKTAIGMNWDCESHMKNKNTSQLSPFLSIGSLSCRFFWKTIKTNNDKIVSARDQLMWRECFNATAIAADLELTSRTDDFWSDSNDSKFIDAKAKDYPWKRDKDIISAWQYGNISPEAVDTNVSMKQLFKNGWIHHLRRHLVADVLTRGKLHQHWIEGILWFRYTLLDHDAAINRCNWMWLSAVAFSSKQKVYHYGWNDYVKRGTPASLNPTIRENYL